jgi:hypothetical protein
MGNSGLEVGNYLIAKPLPVGNILIADTRRTGLGLVPGHRQPALPVLGAADPQCRHLIRVGVPGPRRRFLDGSRHYTLTLDADPPAGQFWSVTTYDNRTRTMIGNDQQRASISSYAGLWAATRTGPAIFISGPPPRPAP